MQFTFDDLDEIEEFLRNYKPWHDGKIAYGHRETAERAARELKSKKNRDLDVYECITCGKWHLGSKRK